MNSPSKAVAAEIERRFARLDALVHCAGIVESEAAESITGASIARQVEVNLVGTILVNLRYCHCSSAPADRS